MEFGAGGYRAIHRGEVRGTFGLPVWQRHRREHLHWWLGVMVHGSELRAWGVRVSLSLPLLLPLSLPLCLSPSPSPSPSASHFPSASLPPSRSLSLSLRRPVWQRHRREHLRWGVRVRKPKLRVIEPSSLTLAGAGRCGGGPCKSSKLLQGFQQWTLIGPACLPRLPHRRGRHAGTLSETGTQSGRTPTLAPALGGWGSVFRIQGSGFRVQGPGCRV